MSFSSPHLPFTKMVDLGEGRLAPDERQSAVDHTAACGACARLVARLERALDLMRTDTDEDAPSAVVARAVSLFAPRARPATSALRRLVASLIYESTPFAPAFGLREGGSSSERQLLFHAGDNEVQLQVAPDGEAWAVTGQVLGPCGGGSAELRGAPAAVDATLNEVCEFAMPAVPAGAYTLTLRLNEIELEVPDLRLGA
jgi:anti-sigma factor RsiW